MNPFTDHPATVGESYLQHMRVALGFGAAMLIGGLACILHALLPALFVTTGSQTIEALYNRMVTKRRQKGLRADAPFDFVI